MAKHGIANVGEPAEVVAKVVTWLATDPEAEAFNGANIEAPYFCFERNMLPEWPGPKVLDNFDPLRHLWCRPRPLRGAEQGPSGSLNGRARMHPPGASVVDRLLGVQRVQRLAHPADEPVLHIDDVVVHRVVVAALPGASGGVILHHDHAVLRDRAGDL